MAGNILFITEDKSNFEFLFSNVSVLRRCETADIVSITHIKRAINSNVRLVVIKDNEYFQSEIFKTIEFINRVAPQTRIIVTISQNNEQFMQKCRLSGVYDFIRCDSCPSEFDTRFLNCLKSISLSKYVDILSLFINNTQLINAKTGLFTHKALKENFYFINEYPLFKTGVYMILTIDDSVKTRVSMNRLGLNLKKCLRQTDIIAQGSGKFYLILPETDLQGAKSVAEKVASVMGDDIRLHCGISVLGVKSFDELEKDANDGLKSAVINDELYFYLGGNVTPDDSDSVIKEKHFKLFKKAFETKLSSLIEPLFFRFQKEFDAKDEGIAISQYANKIECVFSLKKDKRHSELIIRYDGFAKLNFKIVHKGLDTSENTDANIALNILDEKLLSKYINKLYSEFMEGLV